MRKVYLLDCTLRDGGYVNDWNFGEETIKGFGRKIAQTGVEIYEVGFIKGDKYDPNKSVFPDIQSIVPMIQPKSADMKYVGMLDMSAPVPVDRLVPYDGTSVDGIRVIFKKDKIEQAYEYCKRIQELGYFISVNVVGTDLYTDAEFIDVIKKFNTLHPYAFSIVDTFGLIKRKQFLRLAYIADSNLEEGIILAYHAHNNLQLAFGNAEALVEMNLKRDLLIDACVFGMGRGAGNLNLELFAEYMNENYDTHYKIEPMLEIMDEYLNDIYKTKFWGYSLPLYLSATTGS
nr:aldolase catalytic domain-containing protein [Lachnospiraceae bacterium]